MSQPIPIPPLGYVRERPLFADWDALDRHPQKLVLIWANLVALLPLSGGVLLVNTAASVRDIMGAWRVFQAPLDARFSDDHGIQQFIPASQSQFNAL